MFAGEESDAHGRYITGSRSHSRYLLLREADPLKTKCGLLEAQCFLLTVLFSGRCPSTLAIDLLENRLAVRPEKVSRFTLSVSKLGRYTGHLMSAEGLSLRSPS